MSRSFCYQCFRPHSACLCHLCVRVENKTEIFLVQHTRESRHALGTVRIAMLTLSRVKRLKGFGVIPEPVLAPDCMLLYPGENSRDLAQLAPSERPSQLLVLDGTWPQSRGLLRHNPWIQRLPRVSFTTKEEGRYQFRREPEKHCLSSIESIVTALQVLEPETENLNNPLDVFLHMVAGQVGHISGK